MASDPTPELFNQLADPAAPRQQLLHQRLHLARSPPYHSGGTSPAAAHTVSAAMVSIRVSQGSNDSHPAISRYTSLR
jgi:hypothetical protein